MRKNHHTHNPDIKAIETRWNGYRFRSRTEARWAVLLTNLGIKYEYEHEGFVLPSGERYLPDFYLPTLKCILEIKPSLDADLSKPRELAIHSDEKVFIGTGAPDSVVKTQIYSFGDAGELIRAGLVHCPCCCKVSLAQEGQADWLICDCIKTAKSGTRANWHERLPQFLKVMLAEDVELELRIRDRFWQSIERPYLASKIFDAFDAAKSARFEHGEAPEVPR
jgi:hypothetical protein